MNETVFSPSLSAPVSAQNRARSKVSELLHANLSDRAELVMTIRQGLETSAYDALAALGMTRKELDWVINPRTLSHRKTNQQKLTPEESDRLVRVALVVELANQVFADRDKAMRWLNKPKSMYNGLTPFEMTQSEHGAQMVEDDLNRIDAGIAA